jgi:predicted naringenin-chalcone synthase
MKTIIALINFSQQLPKFKAPQIETLDLITKAHSQSSSVKTDDLFLLLKRYGVKSSQISYRHFEDVSLSTEGADILARAEFFSKRGYEIFSDFYTQNNIKVPDHIIHVTCTGYVSPSPAQQIVASMGWTHQTSVTHAYHMGCYASLPAVRMAEGFVAARNQSVDLVHTEMCSLHMDRNDHSPEQMVVQSLFADGHIKYTSVPSDLAKSGFKVLIIKELILPDTTQDMTWITASFGMKMTLSREIPSKIALNLKPFIKDLCEQSQISLSDILTNAIFAVHPGGPKIIDSVQQSLELTDQQVQASRDVLQERGNMSSATLPHVWHKLLQQNITSGKKVVSLAFGPGLTIFGAIFESI